MLAFLGFLLFLYLAVIAFTWITVGTLFLLTGGGKASPRNSDEPEGMPFFGCIMGILVMGYLFFYWLIGY